MRWAVVLFILLVVNVAVMARTLAAAERIEAAVRDLVEFRLNQLGHGEDDAPGR